MAWEKGAGLADLKGVDPMDRRIEIEKRDRYARELREQINSRSQTPQRNPSRPPEDVDWSASSPSGQATMMPSGVPPTGLAGAGASVLGAPPRSPYCSSSASLDPNKAESWGTAGKVSQLQAMIHDRLRYLEEQQRLQWESLQGMLTGQAESKSAAADAARAAAEDAMHKHSHVLKDELGKVTSSVARETALDVASEAAGRVARDAALAVAQEAAAMANREALASAREVAETQAREVAQAAAKEAAATAGRSAALDAIQAQSSELRAAQEGMLARAADDLQKQLQADMEKLRAEMRGQTDLALEKANGTSSKSLQQINGDLQKVWQELERLERVKADRRELQEMFARHDEALEALRHDHNGLRQQIDNDLNRMIQRAVRDEVSRVKPAREDPPKREPTPPPPPEPSKAFKAAPKESFVILKGAADDSVHYLCSLQNVIGRAATCGAVIAHSQSISNQHASIEVGPSGAILRDVGSRNGTWLNERRVGQQEGLKLESGDAIQLGIDGPTYIFEWGPAASKFMPREIEIVRGPPGSAGRHGSSGGSRR